jgi:hypothetical protein
MMCGSHYYCNYNEKLGALNRALDTNRDGKITLNQFMRMVEDRQGGPRKVKKSASAATPAAPESEDGVWITYSKTQARAKSSSRPANWQEPLHVAKPERTPSLSKMLDESRAMFWGQDQNQLQRPPQQPTQQQQQQQQYQQRQQQRFQQQPQRQQPAQRKQGQQLSTHYEVSSGGGSRKTSSSSASASRGQVRATTTTQHYSGRQVGGVQSERKPADRSGGARRSPPSSSAALPAAETYMRIRSWSQDSTY